MAATDAPWRWSIATAAAALGAGRLSARELTLAVLERIAAVDPRTHAYQLVLAEQALATAQACDDARAAGAHCGPLHGIPVALKDIYDLCGTPTTASSRVRADAIANNDATAVALLRAAGAVFIGKTVTDEFAYGTVCPPTRNPWDLDCIPGGSSGGSAAALAAGECLGALGSDTAGSIRTPAALNGIVGLKPTYGRVSKRGLIPLAWSVDHPGPMARTVEDVALLLQVIAGHDPHDRSTAREAVPDYSAELQAGVAGMTIGVPRNYYFEACEPAVTSALTQAIEELRRAGASVLDVNVAHIEYAFAAGRAIVRAEAAAYHEALIRDPATPYGDNTRLAIEAGTFLPASYYLKAQQCRTLIKRGFAAALANCDALLAPTVPAVATRAALFESAVLGSAAFAAINAHVRWAYPANLAGVPALSVPCGFSPAGLPIGMQIIGRPFAEATLLRIARAYERATAWTTRWPSI